MKVELELEGMSCNHCKMAVNEALTSLSSVSAESVEIGRAVVSVEDWESVADEVMSLLEEEGYPVVSASKTE